MEQKTTKAIIYGVNDRPPLQETLFAAVQHLLAIFVAIITPPLIIAKALNMDLATTGFLVSMALFVSGVSTFIQCRKFGPVGCGLLCVQGTSFSFIGPIIAIGQAGGLPLIFGACIAAAPVEMAVSYSFKYLRRIITPLVSGIVVMLIGLSLVKAGVMACGGGDPTAADFGSPRNLIVAATVLASVIALNCSNNKYVRMSSIILGVVVGYVLALCMGMVDFDSLNVGDVKSFYVPVPFEATGDVTANSMVSGEPVDGEVYVKRVSGGVFADGLNSLLAGVFSSFPNSIFAQNNGIIQLTGVASRYVGYFIAAMLVVLGLFPIVGIVFSLMPSPVLGGATLLMFGTVAAAGVRIVCSEKLDRKAVLVIAASLALGMGVELMPDILKQLPEGVRTIFSSGITTGGLTAILANALFNRK